MTKQRWKGSFSNHIDHEKEEKLKWVKIEIEEQVKTILKLTRSINHGNKERNLRKKSEVIQLVEDFQKQYDLLYSLYEDLREEVKKNVADGDDDDDNSSSMSNSDLSESYFSPEELNGGNSNSSSVVSKVSDSENQEAETSDLEDTILKDKLTSSSEVKKTMNPDSEFVEILKDLKIHEEESENTSQNLSQIKDLEAQIASLKLEISTLSTQKRRLEEQVELKSDEAMQMREKISVLESQALENKKQSDDNKQQYLSRISELEAQADDVYLELNTLKRQKGELEGLLSNETKQADGLIEQVRSMQDELVSLNKRNDELEMELRKKSEEASDCLLQMEVLRNELTLNEKGTDRVNDLELEIHSLISKNNDLVEEVKKINREAFESNAEKEKLREKVSELQKAVSDKENELSTEQKKFKASQNTMSMKINSLEVEVKNLKNKFEREKKERNLLQVELKTLELKLEKEKQESSLSKSQAEKKNSELINKIAHQQETLLEMEAAMSKLRDENEQIQTKLLFSRSHVQLVERKVEEMAEEFRKQCEDKYRILSRRIRVAEQLHVESKEWCRKTKEMYEQENKELREIANRTDIGFKNAKDIALTANDALISLDSVALKFEECTANFLNRISKASCELKFAKHWAARKNKALVHVQDDLDCLLAQLDDKEAEILVYREKVWKSDNKVRELEKMFKEKEDAMLVLKEEKREAIRQLCVWIDYHRGRSDYYKKMVSEMNAGRRRTS